MKIGNWPDERMQAKEGKIYWKFSIGRVSYSRMYDWGWRGIELVIARYAERREIGAAISYIIHWGFSFWLPIDSL